MKKSNLFLSVLCIFFCFVASSCNLAEVFDVDETKNEWYYQPFEYQTDNGVLYLESYLLYSDGDYRKPDSFKKDVEIKDGLTIVVVPNVDKAEENSSIVDLFFESSKTYFLYNFPKGKYLSDSNLVKDDDTNEGKGIELNIPINDVTWSTLYFACLNGETETPYVLRSSSGYEEGFKITAKKLSVKRLLAGLILKYLEE